jgi:uncharacterized membrane protein YoaK (UPF0700 family)
MSTLSSTSRTLGRHGRRHLRVGLMMILTFVTGLLDAVGYLGLDRIFTGNMTGNIVILGMGVAAEDDLPVAGPLVALGAYVVGAAVVGRLLFGRERAWDRRLSTIFAVCTVVLTACAAALTVIEVSASPAASIAVASTLAALMGSQAASARFLAVPDMTTVVVTSTITAYAGETLHQRWTTWFTHRRLWAILTIFAGALVGALLMKVHISVPVYLAAVATAATGLAGHHYWQRAA